MSGKEKIVHDVMQAGISLSVREQRYSDWTGTYEKDLEDLDYQGPHILGKAAAECFPENRENKVIIDIAAGTGLVGVELYRHGFRIMDALDPIEKMLDLAKEKNIYRNYICDYVTEKPLNIKENTYDALTICGGMGYGHLPCNALFEMIRLVKPGGYIVIVTRNSHLENVEDYKGKLAPLMDKLEKDGKWKNVKREIFPNYLMEEDGLLLVYQIC